MYANFEFRLADGYKPCLLYRCDIMAFRDSSHRLCLPTSVPEMAPQKATSGGGSQTASEDPELGRMQPFVSECRSEIDMCEKSEFWNTRYRVSRICCAPVAQVSPPVHL